MKSTNNIYQATSIEVWNELIGHTDFVLNKGEFTDGRVGTYKNNPLMMHK